MIRILTVYIVPTLLNLFVAVIIRIFKSSFIKQTIIQFIDKMIDRKVKNEEDKHTISKEIVQITVEEIQNVLQERIDKKYK